MMPKRVPQVQLIPTIVPQAMRTIVVRFWVNKVLVSQSMLLDYYLPLLLDWKSFVYTSVEVLGFSQCSQVESSLTSIDSFGYAQIFFFIRRVKVMVRMVEIMPAMAMMPLRPSIWSYICYGVFFCSPLSEMYSIPYRMQKLIPKTGKKRGIEAAQPFCQSGNSFNNPQGAVMIGICETATIAVINKLTVQFLPAKYLPTAAIPVATVDIRTPLTQCLLKALKMIGVMMTQAMLKLLKRRTTSDCPTQQQSCVYSRIAIKAPTIINMVTETDVTDRIRPHSKSMPIQFLFEFLAMIEQGGFFDTEVTDQFVSNLDDLTYAELVTILRDHFNNQYHQLTKVVQSNCHLEGEIKNGEANLGQLKKIKGEHTQQKLRIGSEIELLELQCERLKAELKHIDR